MEGCGKNQELFPKSKAFLSCDFSALPPTPISLKRLLAWVSLSRFHNHHPNWDLYDGNILESLVYGLSWLQIICKMKKSLELDCFRPETSKKCLVIADIVLENVQLRACTFYSISFPCYLYIKTSHDEEQNKALVKLNWILVLWKHKKWSAADHSKFLERKI